MNTLELLKRGKARIKKGWCQEYYAVDAKNFRAQPSGNFACRWCASGALGIGRETERDRAAWKGAIDALLRNIGDGTLKGEHSVITWNDATGRTREHVLHIYTKAIEEVQA